MTSFLNASVVFAEGGTGAGSQSSSPGIPGQKPLAYLGTVLVDGGEKVDNATDIPLNPKFKTEFDKNVVNILFWTNNSQCFTMKSGNDENIPVNVTKIDDTVDFSQRQYIFVQPVSPLQPGTSYQLKISPKLQAKNGVAILGGTTDGQGVTVSFKTAGEAVQQAAPVTATPAPQPTSEAAAPSSTATSTPAPAKSTSTSSAPASTLNSEKSSAVKATDSNTKNPSGTSDSSKPSDSSEIQNQNVESKESASANTDNSKPKKDEQTTSSSELPSSNETDKGGISSTTWITIIGAVLLVAWITAEIIARKRRK